MVRRLDRGEVFELYQMREIMEGTAARLAVEPQQVVLGEAESADGWS